MVVHHELGIIISNRQNKMLTQLWKLLVSFVNFKLLQLNKMSFKTFVIIASIIGCAYMQQAPNQANFNDLCNEANTSARTVNSQNSVLLFSEEGPWPLVILGINNIIEELNKNARTDRSTPGLNLNKLCELMNTLANKSLVTKQFPPAAHTVHSVLQKLQSHAKANVAAKKTNQNLQCVELAVHAYSQ